MKQVLLIITFIIGLSSSLFANEKVDVVTENWKPFNYEEDGSIKGTATEIVRAVLDRLNINYTITVFPWARSYNMALTQQNVLIYSIIRTPGREELFKWIGPVSDSDHICLFKLSKREDILVESLDDAKHYRIGVAKNSPMHGHLINLGFDKNSIDVTTANQLSNIKKLLFGRIDLLPASEKQFSYAIKEAGFSEGTFTKTISLFSLSPYMALSRKTHDDLVEKIRDSYSSLVSEGKIRPFK